MDDSADRPDLPDSVNRNMQYRYSSKTGSLQDGGWSEDRILDVLSNDANTANTNSTASLQSDTRVPHSRSMMTPLRASELLTSVPIHVSSRLSESIARHYGVVLIEVGDETATVATSTAGDLAMQDKLSFVLAKKIHLVEAPQRLILAAIERIYPAEASDSVDSMICEFTETEVTMSDHPANMAYGESRDLARSARSRVVSARGPRMMAEHRSVPGPQTSRYDLASEKFNQRSQGMFYYTIDDGERVLRTTLDGKREILIGPRRVWRGRCRFETLEHFVAHPGQFLIVRFLDGSQRHLPGPVELWNDPRIHESISCEDCLQLASKEAVVVYSRSSGSGAATNATNRRIVHGPTLFTPEPGEWLHNFSWHASPGGHLGVQKIPNALKFQKLWLMPDQMYHDVPDVRTSDNAVLVIRLMVFFELTDIERMLESTRDPVGDFVNAATADVVEFTGRLMFEEFKQATGKLNELATYRTLLSRAEQIGYRVSNVVYRGYGAADSLQKMHDQAIEASTRLQLDRATEEQSQELEDYRLESQLKRATMRRHEQTSEIQHSLEMEAKKREADLLHAQRQVDFERARRDADDQQKQAAMRRHHQIQQEHLTSLRDLGVDLTSYLTQNRADQVIELRGQSTSPHLHIDRHKHSNPEHADET